VSFNISIPHNHRIEGQFTPPVPTRLVAPHPDAFTHDSYHSGKEVSSSPSISKLFVNSDDSLPIYHSIIFWSSSPNSLPTLDALLLPKGIFFPLDIPVPIPYILVDPLFVPPFVSSPSFFMKGAPLSSQYPPYKGSLDKAFPSGKCGPSSSPKKSYSLQSKYKSMRIIPSQGVLSHDPIQPNPMGWKSHLLKDEEKYVMEIQKGKQVPITRALRVGRALKCPLKWSLYILMWDR
jgi:hypothetical protein